MAQLSPIHWLIIGSILALYFLPTIVGRHKRNLRAIFALNFLAGWTFVGWVVTLIWALTKDPDSSGHRTAAAIVALIAIIGSPALRAGSEKVVVHPLKGVKTVQVDDTVVSDPAKVKEDYAADMLRDELRAALVSAGFEIGESPVKVHLILDEFTSGSTAERLLIGMGAGRAALDCRLVVGGDKGEVTDRIKVRGHFANSTIQGNNTQRRQAVDAFQQRVLEEIYKLK